MMQMQMEDRSEKTMLNDSSTNGNKFVKSDNDQNVNL